MSGFEEEPPIYRFRFRRGTLTEWTAKNPVLAFGEPAIVEDDSDPETPLSFKIGDGVTAFNDLPYAISGGGVPGPTGPEGPEGPQGPAGEVPTNAMLAFRWNGSAYVASTNAGHYVGPTDPGAVPDGSIWDQTA